MLQVFDDVACTVCGCVCDDLRLTVENDRVTRAERACQLAEPWFLEQPVDARPVAEIDGAAADFDAAVARAADILRTARAPLIYGLSRSSTDGQRAACRLADLLGANIDTTASTCHGPSIIALQQVGESTCTLGEISNRADLVVFWGSNPVVSHPRHLERYSADPVGEFLPAGRQDRTLVVVDTQPSETSAQADVFVPIAPGRNFEAIWTLRALLRGQTPAPDRVIGADPMALVDLAERMKRCRCGVIFFGLGLTQTGIGHTTVEALLRLVTDLNAYTRFHCKRMRVYGDVAGADSVLCWQTGYPFSVNLARGYPRYNPGEYSAGGLLSRGEVDACLLVGSEGLATLPVEAVEQLRRLPVIALDYPGVESIVPPTVRFTTAIYGLHLPGTAYRMDEVPIPLRAVLPARYPTDGDVLRRLAAALGDKQPVASKHPLAPHQATEV
jgi:formylmethanofuran dehydrogenase subunit B